MKLKTIILCFSFYASLHCVESNTPEPEKGTLDWLHWSIEQTPQNTLYSQEVKEHLDHYIQLIEGHIIILEEKLEHRSIAIRELRKAGLLDLGAFASIFILGGVQKKYVGIRQASMSEGIIALACIFFGMSTIDNSIQLLTRASRYTNKLQAKLMSDRQLLASLEWLKSMLG
ncbi:MAG: hypothetical protein M1114_02260 [Candidatus Dependentiae bacterium]|nr:hypothetical protein [Candidatus Dependentiae bacterium]